MNYNKPIRPGDEFERKEDIPKINLSRRKRGPAKKTKTKAELELQALTPRMRDLAEGRLKLEDLDWDELVKGQLKDVNGNFTGRAPALLPRMFHERIAEELIVRAQSQFRKNFQSAMDQMQRLVEDPRTPARERLAASQYVIERVMGKMTEKQEIKQEISVFDRLVQDGSLLMDLGEVEEDGTHGNA